MTQLQKGDIVRVVKPDDIEYNEDIQSKINPSATEGWVKSMDSFVGKELPILEYDEITQCYILEHHEMIFQFLPDWLEFVHRDVKDDDGNVLFRMKPVEAPSGKIFGLANEWISIDSAPKDGTVVFGYGIIEGEINGLSKEPEIVKMVWKYGYWQVTPTDGYAVWVYPTHYKPLFNPPKTGENP